MSVGSQEFVSYWEKTSEWDPRPSLAGELEVDVAVLGGGIIGVSAAFELARQGARVALLEARRIGSGATGYTTAKISSLHGLSYARMAQNFGERVARDYGELNEAGVAAIRGAAREFGIDCDLREKANYTYAASASGTDSVRREAEVAKRLGLPAEFVEDVPGLPVTTAGAVRFDQQAEFHPLHYLRGLARVAEDRGVQFFESTRAVSLDQGDPVSIGTDAGATVRTGHAIVATHLPVFDRGLYFARTHPERSYVILARLATEPPQGMYLSDESPAHSIRSVPTEGGELLMVGGASHKTGQADATERYRRLEDWTREHFDVVSVEHRWATQDHLAHDQLPLIGKLWPFADRILAATGMRKWGLAMGASAGRMLADGVLGRPNSWQESFDTMRIHPRASAASFAKQNANDGFHFFRDRLRRDGDAHDLAAGEGKVVGSGLTQRAVYRDDAGELHALSARCTHVGCIVNWNSAEKTWDCPCHASRFSADGEVIEGPAVRPLPQRPLP